MTKREFHHATEGDQDGASTALDGLPPLREIIAAHDLGAKKGLGQHFLFDLNLTGRIARKAGDLQSGTTIEIGPGPGGLTRALLAAGAGRLVVVERDERCRPVLEQIAAAYPGRLEVLFADALQVSPADLGPAPRRIVANLPYNVSTPLLLHWLKDIAALDSLTLMFQKEVVDRIAAQPGEKAYGRLSVIAAWLCEVRPLFDIDPRAFTPPPKVMSTVVTLRPRAEPLAPAKFEIMEQVTAAAFGQRRKMLRRSLSPLAAKIGLASEDLCRQAGLEPTARAEEIPVEGFAKVARLLEV
ncbi:MAG: 16S rRNA (adenine(1518)-N(6)/adenine(1519)-N(6))-dimethyltransferase RsmA [Rhodospirillaceae bacterium]